MIKTLRSDETPHRSLRVLTVAVAATALLAGCGSSVASKPAATGSTRTTVPATAPTGSSGTASAPASTSASSAAAVDLCALLPAAQATAANHVAYDTTSTVTNGDYHGCDYHNAGKSRSDITSLDITLTSSAGCWAAVVSSDGPGTAIPGVGDAAFGYSLGMHVKHGDSCLTVEGQTLAESKGDWSADTVMARTLLQKLFA